MLRLNFQVPKNSHCKIQESCRIYRILGRGKGCLYHGFTEEFFANHEFTVELFAIHGFAEEFFAIHEFTQVFPLD